MFVATFPFGVNAPPVLSSYFHGTISDVSAVVNHPLPFLHEYMNVGAVSAMSVVTFGVLKLFFMFNPTCTERPADLLIFKFAPFALNLFPIEIGQIASEISARAAAISQPFVFTNSTTESICVPPV